MKNQNYSIRISTFLTVAMMALFITASVAFAQGEANVYLQQRDFAEGTFTIDVIADNVTDLYGAEFQLKYDPAMLSVQDAKPDQEGIQIEGGPLLPAGKGFAVANKVDADEGTITFAMTLLNPAPPVSGGGPLAHITFNMLSDGPTTIDIQKAKLVAIDLQTIPSTTAPLMIEGQAQPLEQNVDPPQTDSQAAVAQPEGQNSTQTEAVAAPVNVQESTPEVAADNSQFPWWIIAAAILIFGFLGLVAFVVMSGLLKPQQEKGGMQQLQPGQPKQTQRPVQKPSQSRNQTARTRPSAFK